MSDETNTTAQQIGEVLASFEPQAATDAAGAPDAADTTAQAADVQQAADAQATDDQNTDDTPDPVAALQAKVLELEQRLAAPKPAEPDNTDTITPWDEQSFVPDDFDVDRLDKAGLNKLLNAAASMAYKAAQEGTYKRVLTTVPNIVRNSVVTHSKIQKALNEFYDSNKELIPHTQQVGFIAEQLLAAEPALGNDVSALFKKAGEEARKRLGIKPGQKPTSRGGLTIVNGQGGQQAPALDGIAKEIDAMEKSLNN